MADPTSPWTCPTCRAERTSPFCPQCGERPLTPIDLSPRSLLAKLAHAVTSIDGKFLRTCWQLLREPGTLTTAYLGGIRMPYIAPFQLFLIANVIFFAVQSVTATNIFGASLESHLHRQDWSDLAATLVAQRLAGSQTTLAAYELVFDRAVVVNAKSLVILMVLPFAGLIALAFGGQRRPMLTHVVFALHLYTFLLLLFSFVLVVTGAMVLAGGPGLDSPRVDNVLSALNLAACAAYLFVSIGTVFGVRGPLRLAKTMVLAAAAGALVPGYRFAVFLISLYTT